MNPADLTLPAISPGLTTKSSLALSASLPQKNGKAPVPRVDVEPVYTLLKAALCDHWVEYKAAINAFVLGESLFWSWPANVKWWDGNSFANKGRTVEGVLGISSHETDGRRESQCNERLRLIAIQGTSTRLS